MLSDCCIFPTAMYVMTKLACNKTSSVVLLLKVDKVMHLYFGIHLQENLMALKSKKLHTNT